MFQESIFSDQSVFAKALPAKEVATNEVSGSYRPRFFDLAHFSLSNVVFNSVFFQEQDAERCLLNGDFSFCYLREDKLRTIDAYDEQGELIKFIQFLDRLGIRVQSTNLFKTGKYLSRVFRSTKYGRFFMDLDIHINSNPAYAGKVTDGISIISLELAKALGWADAAPNKSAQFTLFFANGLIKGHCVVSDKISHDVVIYGEDNIKHELYLGRGLQYVAIEPVKLGRTLRMDIQSLLNLWPMFGADQYLQWAYDGIETYKEDLFAGRLNNWLDDFDEIDKEDYVKEQWLLHKAIWHKINYTRFPGLIRSAWLMFRNSLIRFAIDINEQPVFRIPVPGGLRGYLRVDLRNHTDDGEFSSLLNQGEVCLDEYGNLWLHPEDASQVLIKLGNGDQDDSAGIIPVEEGKAVIYRNPNQYGEYVIKDIKYEGITVERINKLIGSIEQKQGQEKEIKPTQEISTGNSLLDKLIANVTQVASEYIPYTISNLLRTYSKVSQNGTSIGVAANGEMVRSSVGITKPKLFKHLYKTYNWNLERIIDSTVKDGIRADEDMQAVRNMLIYVCDEQIEIPANLLNRIPESLRDKIKCARKHPLDELLDAVKFLVKKADEDVLGKGSVSKGNRVPGRIDRIDIPVIEIGIANIDNAIYDIAMNLLKGYNRRMAILLEQTKDLSLVEQEEKRRIGIEAIQTGLLKSLSNYSTEERSLLTKCWAYEIYKTEKSVHDSILWIGGKENLNGTSDDTIAMLANVGIGYHVKSNGSLKRYKEIVSPDVKVQSIRLWSRSELLAKDFAEATELLIDNNKALIKNVLLNIGEECIVNDGVYTIKQIVQSISRRNSSFLRNSITVYLNN